MFFYFFCFQVLLPLAAGGLWNLVLLVLHTWSKQTWSIIIALNWSTTSPKNFKKILEQRLSNKSLFKSVYNVVTVCRMVARRPATPPWLRPLGRWNPSAGSRCGPGGPSGAISPKFTPCTGAQSRGTNRHSKRINLFLLFVFLLCSVPLFRVNPWFNLPMTVLHDILLFGSNTPAWHNPIPMADDRIWETRPKM